MIGALLVAAVLAQGINNAPGYSVGRGGAGGGAPIPRSYTCYGDSILRGATPPACEGFIGEIEDAVGTNQSVPGYTAAQISTCYFTGINGICSAYENSCSTGSACATVVIEGGVNTLKSGDAVTGVIEGQTLATMRAIIEDALVRARRVVWLDVLPYASCDEATCPNLADAHVRASAYNALKAQACAELNNPRLRCVALYDDFEGPSHGELKALYRSADGIHLNQDGANHLACRILTALGEACPEGW